MKHLITKIKIGLFGLLAISTSTQAIINGQDITPNEFPYHVTIIVNSNGKWSHMCSGSIINDNWIVTAAHCLRNRSHQPIDVTTIKVVTNPQYKVDANSNLTGLNSSAATVHDVDKTMESPTYDHDFATHGGDLGLMRVKQPFANNLPRIKIPTAEQYATEFSFTQNVTVAGFGDILPAGSEFQTPSIMKKATMTLLDDDTCRARGFSNRADLIVCLTGVNSQQNICGGDSGGPITFQFNNETYLAGVVSLSSPIEGQLSHSCGLDWAVYTRTTRYNDWINKHANGSTAPVTTAPVNAATCPSGYETVKTTIPARGNILIGGGTYQASAGRHKLILLSAANTKTSLWKNDGSWVSLGTISTPEHDRFNVEQPAGLFAIQLIGQANTPIHACYSLPRI